MASQRAGSRRRSVNFAPSAAKVVITGGTFTGIQQKYETKETSGEKNFLEPLYTRVASNAILNAGGRADEVRCHPGTREEVLGIIEKWIDGDGDLSRSIFWLSGPAGAGKSAIIQTIAERCIQRNAPMANYFFFRADTSRNSAGSVVATLLYQIMQIYPALKAEITTLLEKRPLIFEQSLQDQFKFLIDIPVRAVVGDSTHTEPLVLLIDGLDECSQEAKRVQKDLLYAFHYLISQPSSPFLVLTASRAEPHLVMAFNDIGSSEDSIFLDENYHPSHDIRLFVVAEFDKIKRTHHLARTLASDWPSEAEIEEIVEKSSGQFIYAATIMRFISGSSSSPVFSLDKVRGIRPIVKNSPFAELDAIYTHILSQIEDWDSAKDMIASQLLLPKVTASKTYSMPDDIHGRNLCKLLAPLHLTQPDVESCLSDLVAVVQYDKEKDELIFYHASLQDFLCDESRSKDLYIDLESFTTKLAIAHMVVMSSLYDVALFCNIFDLLKNSTPDLRDTLVSWNPLAPEVLHSVGNKPHLSGLQFSAGQCLATFQRLYYEHDNLFYQALLRKWLTWFWDLGIAYEDLIIGEYAQAYEIWTDIRRSRTQEPDVPVVAFMKRTLGRFWWSMN